MANVEDSNAGRGSALALDDVRVIDAGQLIAGPFAAGLLADYGADVIKIEAPGRGDPIRMVSAESDGVSLGWLTEGRNKRLVTLDIRTDEGRAILLELVKRSDVLVENFRPGTFARLGLSDRTLLDVNPRLVIAHSSGYGHVGPLSQVGAFDRAAVAYSGVGAVTGFPDSPPTKVGVDMADYLTGWHTALQVMVALHDRGRTGRGQVVDTGLFEAPFRLTREMITDYSVSGRIPPRMGNRHQSAAPGDAYLSRDGQWIAVSCGNDAAWRAIARAIGRPELQHDETTATNAARMARVDEVNALMADWIAARDFAEVMKAFEAEGVSGARYNTMADIAAEEQFRAAGAVVEYDHPVVGPMLVPGIVGRLSETPGRIRWLGRALGADNTAVFGELLGLDDAYLASLRASNVI